LNSSIAWNGSSAEYAFKDNEQNRRCDDGKP